MFRVKVMTLASPVWTNLSFSLWFYLQLISSHGPCSSHNGLLAIPKTFQAPHALVSKKLSAQINLWLNPLPPHSFSYHFLFENRNFSFTPLYTSHLLSFVLFSVEPTNLQFTIKFICVLCLFYLGLLFCAVSNFCLLCSMVHIKPHRIIPGTYQIIDISRTEWME